jgi:hypothetical protein
MKYGLMCAVLLLSACGSGGESEDTGHVWKQQTDMIDKARGVEDILDSADAQQRQRIEEQAQ